MSDCGHTKLYALDFANQPQRWDGDCLLCVRDALQSKLDSARAAAAPAKHVAIVTNNNQPGWTNIVETAPNVTLHVGTKLYDESALIGVGVALVEQRAAEIIDLESRLGKTLEDVATLQHANILIGAERDELSDLRHELVAQRNALESRLDETEKQRLDLLARVGYAEGAAEESMRRWDLAEQARIAAERRLTWRRIRDGRPTEPGFYAMVYMPSGPFYRATISTKVATFEEIGDPSHFHDEWQWLGPLSIAAPLAAPSAPSELRVLAAVRAACEKEISFAEGGALTPFGEGSLKAHREILALLSAPSDDDLHPNVRGLYTFTPILTATIDADGSVTMTDHTSAPSEGEKP